MHRLSWRVVCVNIKIPLYINQYFNSKMFTTNATAKQNGRSRKLKKSCHRVWYAMCNTSSWWIALSCRTVWHLKLQRFSRGHNWTQNIWISILVLGSVLTVASRGCRVVRLKSARFQLDLRAHGAVCSCAHNAIYIGNANEWMCKSKRKPKQIKLARRLTAWLCFMFRLHLADKRSQYMLSVSSVSTLIWLSNIWAVIWICALLSVESPSIGFLAGPMNI